MDRKGQTLRRRDGKQDSGTRNLPINEPEPGSRRVSQTHLREVGAEELAGPGQFCAMLSQRIGPEGYPILDEVDGSVVATQVFQVLERHLIGAGEVRHLDRFPTHCLWQTHWLVSSRVRSKAGPANPSHCSRSPASSGLRQAE